MSHRLRFARIAAVLAVAVVTPLMAHAPAYASIPITVKNLDGVPFSDRMVFNRIQTPVDSKEKTHDKAKLRVTYPGTTSTKISALTISGPWKLVSPPALPKTLGAGEYFDLTVQFTATSGRVSNGSLTIKSTASTNVVQLSGYWQSVSEQGQEPTMQEISAMMGWKTNVPADMVDAGRVRAFGDEILSPYWKRADSSKSIGVRQIAAEHHYTEGDPVGWFDKTTFTKHTLYTHDGYYAQSLLPPLLGSTSPANGSISTGSTIGFSIGNELSDDAKNDQLGDQKKGCTGKCGHHIRFFPVKDRAGAVMPNTYFMCDDYASVNYDYQDNVYLLTNVKPA
jgi:hypothetical protein